MRRLYERISVSNIWLFMFFLSYKGRWIWFGESAGGCLMRVWLIFKHWAHELHGIIWLCSWSTFFFCRLLFLGRRCHNLVGFSFSLEPFSIAPPRQLDSLRQRDALFTDSRSAPLPSRDSVDRRCLRFSSSSWRV
ncbi:hypothetical protein BDV09DRAFT_86711 [Aspergillus tetrazonus]|jgi:hypothetical protein